MATEQQHIPPQQGLRLAWITPLAVTEPACHKLRGYEVVRSWVGWGCGDVGMWAGLDQPCEVVNRHVSQCWLLQPAGEGVRVCLCEGLLMCTVQKGSEIVL